MNEKKKKWLPVCVSFQCAKTGATINGFSVIGDTFIEKVLIKPMIMESLGNPVPAGEPSLTFGPPQDSKEEAEAYNYKQAESYAATIKVKAKKRAPAPKKSPSKKKKKRSSSSSYLKKKDAGDWVTLGNGKKMKMKKKR